MDLLPNLNYDVLGEKVSVEGLSWRRMTVPMRKMNPGEAQNRIRTWIFALRTRWVRHGYGRESLSAA